MKEKKEGFVVLEAGRTLITSKTYDVTVTGLFSSSALTQLEDWESNSTDVVFVGYTLDDRILIREGNVLFNQGFEGWFGPTRLDCKQKSFIGSNPSWSR